MVTNNPKAPGGVDTWILYLVGQINPTSPGSGPTIPGGVEGGLRNLEKVVLLNPTTPGGLLMDDRSNNLPIIMIIYQ